MNGHNDAVDDVLAAFSDHLEHGFPRPALDSLNPHDRRVAEDLMRLMETSRGIDPSASAPSLEALLADTEFADSLPAAGPTPTPPPHPPLRPASSATSSASSAKQARRCPMPELRDIKANAARVAEPDTEET